jgi:hypothetical protein
VARRETPHAETSVESATLRVSGCEPEARGWVVSNRD